MDFIEIVKKMMTKNIKPEEMAMQILKQNSNPMMNNLIEMGKNGNTKGIENFARNLFKENGRNFDKEFNEFMNKLK